MLVKNLNFFVNFCYLKRILFLHFECLLLFTQFLFSDFFFNSLLLRSYYILYAKLFFNIDRFLQYTFYKRKKRYFRFFTKSNIFHSYRRKRRLFKVKFFWSTYLRCSSFFKGSKIMRFLKQASRCSYKLPRFLSFLFLTHKTDFNRFWLFLYYKKIVFFDVFSKFLISFFFFKKKFILYLNFMFILFYKKILFMLLNSLSTFSLFYFYKKYTKSLLLK